MQTQTLKVEHILNGEAGSSLVFGLGQYLASQAIDPDQYRGALNTISKKANGYLNPLGTIEVSGSNVTADPNFFITDPQDTLIYTYLANGRLVSYTSAWASETLVGTVTSSSGNGAAYYNNYIYLASNTDVARYGPMNSSPALTSGVWTAATLGSQTALVNFTNIGPNHPMFSHVDNKLYFSDFVNNVGLIHFIKTTKTTNPGDTNDGSTYNALDLPFGYRVTDIDAYGTDLAILAVLSSGNTVNQGPSVLFLWDTISESFYAQIPVPNPSATALHSFNGNLYVWAGNGTGTCCLYRYIGGQSFELIDSQFTGFLTPLCGGTTSQGNKLIWSSGTSVRTMGYISGDLPSRAKHNVFQAASGSTAITAVSTPVNGRDLLSTLAVGYNSKVAHPTQAPAGGQASFFYSPVFRIAKKFKVTEVRTNLSEAVQAGVNIDLTIIFDDNTNSVSLTSINNTNYPGEQAIRSFPLSNADGLDNFILELSWTGTVNSPVKFPIEIDIIISDI